MKRGACPYEGARETSKSEAMNRTKSAVLGPRRPRRLRGPRGLPGHSREVCLDRSDGVSLLLSGQGAGPVSVCLAQTHTQEYPPR